VRGRDELFELRLQIGAGQLRTGVRGGHHHVHPVRLSVDVLVDPGQLGLQLLGREVERAENAEPAGPAHRRHHVAAVAEGEDRHLEPEPFRHRSPHTGESREPGRNSATCSTFAPAEPGWHWNEFLGER